MTSFNIKLFQIFEYFEDRLWEAELSQRVILPLEIYCQIAFQPVSIKLYSYDTVYKDVFLLCSYQYSF